MGELGGATVSLHPIGVLWRPREPLCFLPPGVTTTPLPSLPMSQAREAQVVAAAFAKLDPQW